MPTTRLAELWQTLVETLEMLHTLVLLAGFVASQRFPSGSSGLVATLSSAACVLFAGGPVARWWRIGDDPLLIAVKKSSSHFTPNLQDQLTLSQTHSTDPFTNFSIFDHTAKASARLRPRPDHLPPGPHHDT